MSYSDMNEDDPLIGSAYDSPNTREYTKKDYQAAGSFKKSKKSYPETNEQGEQTNGDAFIRKGPLFGTSENASISYPTDTIWIKKRTSKSASF